jgi:hypothetical protein
VKTLTEMAIEARAAQRSHAIAIIEEMRGIGQRVLVEHRGKRAVLVVSGWDKNPENYKLTLIPEDP